MKRVIVILVFLGIAVFALFWLKQKLSSTNEVIIDKEPIIIGYSLGVLKEERWLKDKDFFVERAEELGVSVNVLMTHQDVDTQILQIKNLIAQKVKVIVVIPSDFEKLTPVIKEAHQAGIKIIAYDRLIMSEDLDLYISFDNEKVGEMQAGEVLDAMGGSGKIAYIGGSPTDNNAYLVRNGAMRVLGPAIESGDVELVIDEFMNNWDPVLAYKTVEGYLSQGGSFDGIVAANDGTAFGSINALEEFDLAGEIPVSGQDAELAACQRIVDGTQTMTVYKPIKTLAYKAAEIAVSIARGSNAEVSSSVFVNEKEIPAFLIEPTIVNKETMEETVIRDGFYSYEEVYGSL
jgi:D-xylose transport system substrate-binding protein